MIEHSANRDPINACGLDTKADDAAGEHVHDQRHPMASQQNRFDTEQVDTPEAILGVAKKGQLGRAVGTGFGAVVFCQYAADDILIDRDAKGVSDLLGDAHAAELRITGLHLDDRRDELSGRTFRAWLASLT